MSYSHVWLFEGAEGGKWVEDLARGYPVGPALSNVASEPSFTEVPVRTSKKTKLG